MSRLPTCRCGHNLVDHADVFDEAAPGAPAIREGECLVGDGQSPLHPLAKRCACRMFVWNKDPDEADIVLSPAIALMNAKALGSADG